MAILILDRFDIKELAADEWFADCEMPMYIFTEQKYVEDYKNAGFKNVTGFENFDLDACVELEALKLAEKINIDKIFVCDERDILRGSKLREHLRISGQTYDSAIAYRNKVQMKTILACNGIKVPPFKKIESVKDVLDFIRVQGYPILIKPVDLYAAINTEKITNYDELNTYCSKIDLNNMMIEKFVDAGMVSCNGLVVDNKIEFISTTVYLKPRLQYNDYLIAVTIQSKTEYTSLIEDYCIKVVETLPPLQTSVFHSEVFINDSNCSLCEIASRPAGGGITESIKYSYGIDLFKEWARATYMESYQFPKVQFQQLSGSLIVPKRKGTVKKMINKIPYSWVVEYQPEVREGDIIEEPQRHGDIIAIVIVVGDNWEELMNRFEILKLYFDKNLIII